MFKRYQATKTMLVTSLGSALLLSGCGTPTETRPEGPVEVVVGTNTPGLAAPSLLLGQDQGIYKARNLDVKLEFGAGVGALLPGMVSGDLDVLVGNYIPFIQAVEQGIPLRMVAGNTYVEEDFHGLFVLKSSEIQGPGDLKGKTLASNTLRNTGELAYNEYLETAGLSPKDVKFTEVGFPDMAAMLERGEIDVAWLPGQFRTAAENSGKFRMLIDLADIPAIKNLPNTGFVATKSWVEKNPEVVKRLQEAVTEADEYTNSNPEKIRGLYVKLARMPQKLADESTLERYSAEISKQDIQRMIDLMLKWKFIKKPIDLDSFMG